MEPRKRPSPMKTKDMRLTLASLILLFLFLNKVVVNAMNNDDKSMALQIESLRKTLGTLSRQVMLQHLFMEERIRSEADSGLKQVREHSGGTRNYYSATHTNAKRVGSIHDHSNNIRTVGMGELIAVLNGVEFRTRHNDYRLNMPHRTSKDWHATEPIPFPDVPPEVTGKATVDEQVLEMHEWFKAWKEQNRTVRDYTKYFKPVLCYLEGAWTTETDGKIDEPFDSDRHFIDASSWFDLQEKIRFTSYTGRKDNNENFAFLPTTIANIVNESIPVFSQWNYRILCHPLKRDIPLNRFRVVDELHSRLPGKRTLTEQSMSRAARFQLNPFDVDQWKEGAVTNGLLDELMSEIPGKDNYNGNLVDDAFGLEARSVDSKRLNAAFYHRCFQVQKRGAMGQQRRYRGIADQSMFMAMTSQPKVSGMTQTSCTGRGKQKVCQSSTQRWSYAFPLEVLWLTPLHQWNPYELEYKGNSRTPEGRTVTAQGRNGGKTAETAYDGTNSKRYYLTPVPFYQGQAEVGRDKADTARNAVWVLDKNGKLRATRASGTRIFLPYIPGVGVLRQRYPIMPVHGEGSSVWKELEAVKDILLQSKTYGYMYREPLDSSAPSPTEPPKPITLQITRANSAAVGPHTHDLTLQPDQVEQLRKRPGSILIVKSDTAAGHEHTVTIRWLKRAQRWFIQSCDSKDTGKTRCWDGHGKVLMEIVNV